MHRRTARLPPSILASVLVAWSPAAPAAPTMPKPTGPVLNTTQPQPSPLPSPSPLSTSTSRVEQSTPAPAAKPDRADVDLGDNFFSPRSVMVRVGTRVVWHNRGGGENQHNVEAEDSSFRSGDISPGLTFAH